MNVLLGDAAPDLYGRPLSQLNLGIDEVDAYRNGEMTVLAKYSKPVVVNVLNFPVGGQTVANTKVSSVQYDQLRLIVDLASSTGVFKSGTTMPINFLTNQYTWSTVGAGANTSTTPVGNNAVSIVVTQPFSIPQSGNNAVRLDFNAFEALDLWSQGGLVALPALFVSPIDTSGMVSGKVVDAYGNPVSGAVIVATASNGSIGNTGVTDSNGNYMLDTLPYGYYSITVYNWYMNAAGREFTSSSNSQNMSVQGPTVDVQGPVIVKTISD